MTLFVIIAVALVTATLASLFLPLRGRHGGSAASRREQNIAIARQRLQELEATAAESGDDQLAQTLRNEIESALAEDLESAATGPAESRVTGKTWLFAVALLVPLFSTGLYLMLGEPGAMGPLVATDNAQHADMQQPSATDDKLPSIETMVAKLEEKLEENPENVEGWMLAGRTYMSLAEFVKAENAYRTLHGLVGDDADILAAWVDATIMANQFRFTPEVMDRLQRALTLDPNHIHALWISALAAEDSSELDRAMDYLERLQPLVASDPDGSAAVAQMVQRIQPGAAQAGTAGSSKVATESAATEPAAPTDVAASITVSVALDPAMLDHVSGDDAVFVFARALEGPPMPLAVSRHRVSDLPLTVTLDDSMAMVPEMKLSNFGEVLVSARISLSGQPIARPGDVESAAATVTTISESALSLTLDRLRPE